MRKEAGREEWKKLYDVATRIRELKPWEDFWDLDLICLREDQTELAEKIEKKFSEKYDVLYDDRKERAGVKFADADLVGAPIRITIGKKAADGIVEVKRSTDDKATEMSIDELDKFVNQELG